MEQLLSGSIWQSQVNGLQGYHTAVLQHLQACYCPSGCIPKRPWCHPPSRWLPSYLYFQSSYTCGAAFCQHRTWTACLCLWSRLIPHLSLCLHYWELPQASWTDQHKESGRYTCLSTENDARTPKLWCHHQVLTCKEMLVADALSCYAPLRAPEIPLDIIINHVHITPDRKTEFQTLIQNGLLFHSLTETIIAGWPDDINDVPTCSMPIPWPQKHPNSWRWPHTLRWSSHHSSIRKGGDPPSKTWRTHGNQQVSKQSHTLCIPAQNQLRHQMSCWIIPNMPTSLPTGTMTTTPVNTSPRMPMATPQCWLLPLWWIWIPRCHRLLLQDAHHWKNPCISMQCLQDHLSPEGTLCRTWHPRGTPYWQWPPVCQCTLHQVCNRLEVWP